MSEIDLKINGRNYGVACDAGQEDRVVQLASYVDDKVKQIAQSGAAHNDTHLLVLASLVMADELYEAKSKKPAARAAAKPASALSEDDEITLTKVIDHLTGRIEAIASRLEAA